MNIENLRDEDVVKVVKALPATVIEQMRQGARNGHLLCVGGGFIRSCIQGEAPHDLDLFVSDREEAKKWAKEYGEPEFVTENAISVSIYDHVSVVWHLIQYVIGWEFRTPVDVIKGFDFTICQACVFWNDTKWEGICAPNYYQDLERKKLVYTRPVRKEKAAGSFLRVLKFLRLGYTINDGDLAAVMGRVFQAAQNKNEPVGDIGQLKQVIQDARPCRGSL